MLPLFASANRGLFLRLQFIGAVQPGQFVPAVHVKFAVDIFDIIPNSIEADIHELGDGFVSMAVYEQANDGHFLFIRSFFGEEWQFRCREFGKIGQDALGDHGTEQGALILDYRYDFFFQFGIGNSLDQIPGSAIAYGLENGVKVIHDRKDDDLGIGFALANLGDKRKAGLFKKLHIQEDELDLHKIPVKLEEFFHRIHGQNTFYPGRMLEKFGKGLAQV